MGQSQKLGLDHESSMSSRSDEFIGPKSMINKSQYIRLLEQSLRSLGFGEVASALESASVGLHSYLFCDRLGPRCRGKWPDQSGIQIPY